MKPEYIGIGNFDEYNYVYAYCNCGLSLDYAIKWPRIKDGKSHTYTCTCEDCGTEVSVVSKSFGPEVLSKEPCTDAISRQAVLEIIRKCHCEEWVKADIGASIEALQPIIPAEKVGQWIDIQYFKADDTYYRPKCPFCSIEPKEYSNYCPNCGAKMQEVKNDKRRSR